VRIAVIAGPAPGHVFPALALACGLRAAGHQVLVCSGDDWAQHIAAEGLTYLRLPFVDGAGDIADFGYRLHDLQAQMAPLLAAEVGAWGAEAVVADTLTACGHFAAQLLRLPWVELVPHPLQDVSADLPPPGNGLAPAYNRLHRLRDEIMRRQTGRSLRLAAEQRARAGASIGLDGSWVRRGRLVASLPALEFPRTDWPADTVVVGPLVWDPAREDLPLPEGSGPLVFVSASTVPGRSFGLLDAALEGLDGAGMRLVCTTLERYDGPLPPWARVGPGRQAPLLGAASVQLSGAGNGILCKGLCAGLPLVLVPGEGDQRENAARAALLGAAEVIPPDEVTPARIHQALRQVLGARRYRSASRRAAATGRGLGVERAVAVTEGLLTGAPVSPRRRAWPARSPAGPRASRTPG
jgi:UDP:flavonoid glycosyltransferase YjiC (YdhE family)